MDKVHAFYCRKPWKDLSYRLKVERGGRCERCNFIAVTKEDWAQLIGHHTVELDDEKVDDPTISLNPDLVEIICLDCHNKEHRRFGHQKHVYIVWGSPLSGKTSAVREMMRAGDIVLDIDRLWSAITMQHEYSKPDNVRFNVFALRDNLMDQIKTRHGQWYDAYVIGGYPDKYDRERLAQTLGAELIYCESTMRECLDRRRESGRPEKWDQYITDWWATYERTGS
nr:MAG TPA: HNH endonuclease [Caudoviricetes sp.]